MRCVLQPHLIQKMVKRIHFKGSQVYRELKYIDVEMHEAELQQLSLLHAMSLGFGLTMQGQQYWVTLNPEQREQTVRRLIYLPC